MVYRDPDAEGYYSDFSDDENPGGTGNDDLDENGRPRMADPPPGFIPRKFLETLTRELTDEEVDEIIATGQYTIGTEHGQRAPTREEVRAAIQQVTGIRDIRTGEIFPPAPLSGVNLRTVRLDLGGT